MDSLGLTSLGLTWIRLASHNLTYLTWTPLKPLKTPVNHSKNKALRDETPAGGPDAEMSIEIHENASKTSPVLTRRLQNSPRRHHRCSTTSQIHFSFQFASIRFHKAQQRATARPSQARATEDYSRFQTPATGTSSSHAHTQLRIARTNETKRFPGCLTPQPPIYIYIYIYIYVYNVIYIYIYIYGKSAPVELSMYCFH